MAASLAPSRNAARRRALLASTSLIAAFAATAAGAQQLPTGGSVASGAASIGQSGSAMTINQTSSRAVINWNGFSIGAGASVTFAQPNAGSATLNRVTGASPSTISGLLSANGQVYLVNPNGVLITRSGVVNTGAGFVASTLALSDQDFNRGKLNFRGGGASAAVGNEGTITTGPGGFVGLLGGTVSNSGVINAPLGKVALASGEQATLDFDGDGFLQVALPTDAKSADGKALIEVAGTVKAGSVAIKAATAANAVRNAINLSGYVSARTARQVGGSIVLGGGDGGDVKVSGKLDASGRARGGAISVTGHDVALTQAKLRARGAAGGSVAVTGAGAVKLAQTQIDVSGANGGGAIAIGGGARGLGPLQHAASTTIETSVLKADALASGNGGSIAVWSDGVTKVAGLLTAQGGPVSGDGGTVETSGHELTVGGAVVRAGAAHGKAGSWLLDPTDLIIDAAAATSINQTLGADTNVTLTTFASGPPSAPFTLSAAETNSAGKGDIIVNSALGWSTSATLTLNAYNNIVVNADIAVSGSGNVVFNTGFGQTGVPGFVQFALNDTGPTASLTFAPGAGTLTINGAGYRLLRTPGDLALVTATPSGNFALANDITPAAPITTSLAANFTGAFNGLGHNLNNVIISQGAATQNVGLFGDVGSAAVVSNLFLNNVNVTGGTANAVGAIAGVNDGAIVNSGASGAVSSNASQLGGLVGFNSATGLVLQTSNSVAVNGSQGANNNYVGGVAGYNDGGIVNSFSTGVVTGGNYVGGVAGFNDGYVNGGSSNSISGNSLVGGVVGQNEFPDGGADFTYGGVTYGNLGYVDGGYAYGDVSGTSFIGGAVGQNFGQVQFTFANARVSGVTSVGGLVGENDNAINNSYAIGQVNGTTNVGGLVGNNNDFGTIDSAFALGAVIGAAGSTNVGGLVGRESGVSTVISNAYSTGFVGAGAGSTGVGPSVGAVAGSDDSITHTYWDTLTTNQTTSAVAGPTGLTTTQLQNLQGGGNIFTTANFAGGATGVGPSGIYPYLTTLYANGVNVVSGFAYTDNGATPLASTAAAAQTVYVDTAGSVRNHSTTGANGYYYVFLDPATLPTGAGVVAYTTNATAPATNAATYTQIAGTNTAINILGSTFNETTPALTYSQLVAAVNAATNTDTFATGAINGVTTINITASGASFNVDQAITPQANVTLNAGAVTISSPITTNNFSLNATSANINASVSGANVAFNAPVTLSANVAGSGFVNFADAVTLGATSTVTSPSTFFGGGITATGAGVGLTTSGAVTLSGNVTTNNGPLSFGGLVTLDSNVTINTGTAAANFLGGVDSSGDSFSNFYSLTVNAGSMSFGGPLGDYALGPVSLTSVAPLTIPATIAQSLFAQTTGAGSGITLGGVLTLSGAGTVATLVSAGPFTNNVGAGAIPLTAGQRWLVYLPDPTGSNFDNLNSNNYPIFNAAYPSTAVPAAGSFYLFANQPTATFTSINDFKTYGQDVTTRVAGDFTVTGLQPGVPGAYLGGVAGAYTGAPSVTSAGSPASANAGTYAINVAQGTLAALNGYALAFASPGLLTVGQEAITVTSTANSKVYDATTSAAAAPTVTSGTLFDAATLAETYATPNAGTGLTLNPTISFANPTAAANYTVTLAPVATGVITPASITITASATSKTYNATTAAAATPTVTSGTLYDTASLAETYATPNAGTGLTLNPTINFANPSVAANYAVTLAPATTGVINPEPITIAATPFTKVFDGTTNSAAAPNLVSGTLFDPATLSQRFASADPGAAINLIPSIAFASAGAANNYLITLVPTGVIPPNTGVILPGQLLPVNESPSVFVNRTPALGIPDFTTTCAVAPQLPDPNSFSDPAAAIQAISAAAAQYVERCRDASQQDIGNALDAYADALDVVIQKLPAKLRVQLQHIPRLVHAAAERARVAPTRAAAVRVLRATVAAVQREISLVRADDPDSARIRAAVSTGVTGVLNTAALSLARAEGI